MNNSQKQDKNYLTKIKNYINKKDNNQLNKRVMVKGKKNKKNKNKKNDNFIFQYIPV